MPEKAYFYFLQSPWKLYIIKMVTIKKSIAGYEYLVYTHNLPTDYIDKYGKVIATLFNSIINF